MSTHEAILALPTGGNANPALIRALLTRRLAYALASSEDASTLDVVDPDTGIIPLYLIQNGALFEYDSTDTTTAAGATCLVTNDGKRYKTSAVAFPYSVLSVTTSAQPSSPAPTIGDTYLIPTGATGTDWSGQDGKIGIFGPRGWEFVTAAIGQRIYNEDDDSFYYKNASGTWTAGFGAQTLGAGAVLPSNMSGGGGKVRWFVENQTTNTPPGSPSANVEYIIGSSPTGAWAGKAAQIARYENSAWSYYVPAVGWRAYDKSLAYDVTFDGTSWLTSAGAVIFYDSTFSQGTASSSLVGSTNYLYSSTPTVAPTTSNLRLLDGDTITRKARRTGAILRFSWSGLLNVTIGGSGAYASSTSLVFALFRDNETSAIAWAPVDLTAPPVAGSFMKSVTLSVTAPDASSHTYKMAITYVNAGGNVFTQCSSISCRLFEIREFT